ncbi:hypothetical protein LGZ99_17140 [Photorhabdus temperata]|uniref:Uncharacterized protein n=1 Tax=Photorhabdus temperata J3 TaxID=1389415 RepID=U7QVI4_PHOTE|nr:MULTISPECIES: hypothetical protein [Photorhabdus]ERT11312.1 hypothetical protein O185_20105 [Photorhabdus temperata J3]MCC8421482.1 hypothetical protein [Photorhabdus thracensis]MCT8348863.1 hypothetical protein [Photorhabdus temperata]
MSSEKIAFIFPATKDARDREEPILSFRCPALPVETKIIIAVAFVGLHQSKDYLISIDITDSNGTTILHGRTEDIPAKVSVTADDLEAEPTDVPGFLSASVSIRVINTGIYAIKCSIARADTPDETIHKSEAHFRMILSEAHNE